MSALRPLTLALVCLSLLSAACARPPVFNGTVLDPPMDPSSLEGVNWDGSEFSLEQLRGKVAILFFGYTYCPDVCPLTLVKMKQVMERLGDSADEVEMVFVTVDPQRDTVEKLAAYVPNFDRGFFGVRLDDDALTALFTTLLSVVVYMVISRISKKVKKPGAPVYAVTR